MQNIYRNKEEKEEVIPHIKSTLTIKGVILKMYTFEIGK